MNETILNEIETLKQCISILLEYKPESYAQGWKDCELIMNKKAEHERNRVKELLKSVNFE